MGLTIQTTGIEQYSPGGNARLKVLLVGGPGVGKTRFASFWPKPFYLDCEGGLASVADRKVPFVEIKRSQDMLDALDYLKLESRRGNPLDRKFQTVIVDTIDAFQRKVKDEWLQAHPGEQSFRGFEAWGYLDSKMQMLLTRLLNLDMNVYVCAHPVDSNKKDEDGEKVREVELQLSGSIKTQIFNDFDLVGWMGKYHESVEGQRVEKRGITFTSSSDRPFLKDRLNITPKWLEVSLEADEGGDSYAALWARLAERLDEFGESEVIGEIETAASLSDGPADVVAPMDGGAVAPITPQEIPIGSMDKPTLQKICRDEGVTTTEDGQPIKGNTLKGELVKAIEAHRAKAGSTPAEAAAPAAEPAAAAPAAAPEPEAPAEPAPAAQEAPVVPEQPAAPPIESVLQGDGTTVEVNTATGEVVSTVEATEADAIATIEASLGAEVVEVSEVVPDPTPEPTAAPEPGSSTATPAAASPLADKRCEECGKSLAGEEPDMVRLGRIKTRKYLCNDDFLATRK